MAKEGSKCYICVAGDDVQPASAHMYAYLAYLLASTFKNNNAKNFCKCEVYFH